MSKLERIFADAFSNNQRVYQIVRAVTRKLTITYSWTVTNLIKQIQKSQPGHLPVWPGWLHTIQSITWTNWEYSQFHTHLYYRLNLLLVKWQIKIKQKTLWQNRTCQRVTSYQLWYEQKLIWCRPVGRITFWYGLLQTRYGSIRFHLCKVRIGRT